jgi:hypothetical protein
MDVIGQLNTRPTSEILAGASTLREDAFASSTLGSSDTPVVDLEKKGLTTQTKVLIGIGGMFLLGGIAFLIFKSK